MSAKDLATQREQSITITASSGLTKDEIEEMVREAEAHKSDDAKRKDEIEAKNQADQIIYSTEKLLSQNAGKLPAAEEQRLREAIDELKKVKETGGLDQISQGIDKVNQASQSLAQLLYDQAKQQNPQQGEAPPPPPQGDSSQKKGGDVIDAEFEDVK